MRKLRDAVLFAALFVATVVAYAQAKKSLAARKPARYCPLCGGASELPVDAWEQIERDDEEILCGDCLRVPRLWVKARPQ